MAELRIGDMVEIVKYGRLYSSDTELKDIPLFKKEAGVFYYDMSPFLVGRIGAISDVFPAKWKDYDIEPMYALDMPAWGILSWFYASQLKKIRDE